jgi:hypothetical protein
MTNFETIFKFYEEKSKQLKAENPSLNLLNWEIELPFSEFEKLPPHNVDYSQNQKKFSHLKTNYDIGCIVWFRSPLCELTGNTATTLPNYKPL